MIISTTTKIYADQSASRNALGFTLGINLLNDSEFWEAIVLFPQVPPLVSDCNPF